MSSTYIDDFCHTVDPKFKYNNILKFKKFELVSYVKFQLNYAETIKDVYTEYITKWGLLEQTEQYKELVLDFVRSFYSTCISNIPNHSVYTKDYVKSRKGDFYNKHGTFITDNKSKPLKILTTEELREKLGIDEMKKGQSQNLL